MKVGDLIVPRPALHRIGMPTNGIIIEVGVYVGNKDIKVMWDNGKVMTYKSKDIKVIK